MQLHRSRSSTQTRKRRRQLVGAFDSLEARLCLSTYNISSSSPANIVLHTKPGVPTPIQYSFSTNDSDDVTENEPLVIHSNDGSFADIKLQPVYGKTPALQTVNVVTKNTKSIVTATIQGGDGDESAVIVTQGEIDPKSIKPQKDHSIDVTYEVVTPLQAGTTQTIGVFWASGKTGNDVLPSGNTKPLFEWTVKSTQGLGTYHFTIPANSLTTAPDRTAHLLIVADPASNLGPESADHSIFAAPANLGSLTAAQVKKIFPKLSAASAAVMAGPLTNAMSSFGINSLEQRAMFLAQIGHESLDLFYFKELGSDSYFVNLYWVKASRWSGLSGSTPTTSGLTLSVPAINAGSTPPPQTKNFQLYWSTDGTLNGSTLLQTSTFKLTGNRYTFAFPGAVPPALVTKLLVVDPATHQVKLSINQNLGNWSPQDAKDFRGRGPIQLTGRLNFQKFANYVGQQDIMTDPSQVSDKTMPLLGFKAAGWFWNTHDLSGVANDDAGDSSASFNKEITKIINGGTNGLSDRLSRYLRIRGQLLDPSL